MTKKELRDVSNKLNFKEGQLFIEIHRLNDIVNNQAKLIVDLQAKLEEAEHRVDAAEWAANSKG